MFNFPTRTRFDLHFRIFDFPVLVHPMFWFVALLLGPINNLTDPNGALLMLIWIACVFVSLLLHELGHAFAFRHYRCPGVSIWLHWFGGVASAAVRPRGHWGNIAVSLAGPGAQLGLFGLIWLTNEVEGWSKLGLPWTFALYRYLAWINVWWAAFNLLPIDPLDGGQICREICEMTRLRRPDIAALRISLGTALITIAAALVLRFVPNTALDDLPWWVPIPNGFLCLLCLASLACSSYERLQQAENHRGHWRDGNG